MVLCYARERRWGSGGVRGNAVRWWYASRRTMDINEPIVSLAACTAPVKTFSGDLAGAVGGDVSIQVNLELTVKGLACAREPAIMGQYVVAVSAPAICRPQTPLGAASSATQGSVWLAYTV